MTDLDDKVLSRIFQIMATMEYNEMFIETPTLPPIEPNPQTVLRISLVCRRFREVLIKTGGYGHFTSSNMSNATLNRKLHNIRETGSLGFLNLWYTGDESRFKSRIPLLASPYFANMLGALSIGAFYRQDYLHRMKVVQGLMNSIPRNLHFPNLVTLYVYFDSTDDENPPPGIRSYEPHQTPFCADWSMPNLREIITMNTIPVVPNISQLASFEFTFDSDIYLSLKPLVYFLQHAKSLERLVLEFHHLKFPADEWNESPFVGVTIELLRLKFLRLYDLYHTERHSEDIFAPLMVSLRVPNLKQVEITAPLSFGKSSIGTLGSTLSPLSTTTALTEATIHLKTPKSKEDIASPFGNILNLLPTLQYLELQRGDSPTDCNSN